MASYFKFNSAAHKSVEKVFQLMEDEGLSVEALGGNVRFFVNDSKGNSVMTTVVDADSSEEVLSYPPSCEWRLRVFNT